jgi:outer membrane immunogenic protein
MSLPVFYFDFILRLSRWGTAMHRRSLAIIAAVSTISLAQIASAADLPPPPPPPPVFSWTGCYLGGYVGGAWSNGVDFTDLGNANFPSYSGGVASARIVPSHTYSVDDSGGSFIGGGTLGCNWQPVGSTFVLGLEGEFGYLSLKADTFDSRTLGFTQTSLDVLGSAKLGNWYGMATARLGYAIDRLMLYVKGGAAFVRTQASVLDQCQATGCGNWLISTSGSETATTWTIGGGLEWAFAQNWSVKGEYMFIGLSNHDFRTSGFATPPSGPPNVVAGGPFVFNHSFDGIHTAKIGLNYRFY